MVLGSCQRKVFKKMIIYSFAVVVAIVILAPLLWLVISSISTEAELISTPIHWIPERPTLKNYSTLLLRGEDDPKAHAFKRSVLNSFIVASSVTLVCMAVGIFSAYAFARHNFTGSNKIFYSLLFAYMIPPISITIPLYVIMSRLRLLDNLFSLIITYSSILTGFVVWIMRGYFQTISRDLEDAARIDGCSKIQALFKIVLPLSIPGIVATALFCFLMSWEEFFIALIFTMTPAAKTMPVTIAEFAGRHFQDYGMMASAGVLGAIPPVFLALFFQKYLIRGLTSGAIKG